MRWPQDALGWPMAAHSRQVLLRPHRWHVQEAGNGPTLLLIHGAGGATQSWRGLFPLLAARYHVVAVDLPGQGFTQMGARQRCGLDHMAEDLLALVRHQGWKPHMMIGHSAGVPVALRMAELGGAPECGIVGLNAALQTFRGVAGWLFPAMARFLALTPFAASVFAASANERVVRGLIKGTGSQLDDTGIALYLRLASDRAHVDGTLAMMAQWRLDGLLRRLPQTACRLSLLTGLNDLAVPPATSREAAKVIPGCQLIELPGLGHLAHEEEPVTVFRYVTALIGS